MQHSNNFYICTVKKCKLQCSGIIAHLPSTYPVFKLKEQNKRKKASSFPIVFSFFLDWSICFSVKFVVSLIFCCTVSVSAYVHGLLQELLDKAHSKIEQQQQQQKKEIIQIAMLCHSEQLSSERCTNHYQRNTTIDPSDL